MKLSKRDYQLSFIALTKSFVNNDISTDAYSAQLHTLIKNYRKDYPHV